MMRMRERRGNIRYKGKKRKHLVKIGHGRFGDSDVALGIHGEKAWD